MNNLKSISAEKYFNRIFSTSNQLMSPFRTVLNKQTIIAVDTLKLLVNNEVK